MHIAIVIALQQSVKSTMKLVDLLFAVCLVMMMCSVHRNNAQVISTECLLASNGTAPLPNFTRPIDFPPRRFEVNPIQGIITSYRFSCYGVITEWATFVHRARSVLCYSISFEIWRPTPMLSEETCYVKVGTNYVRNVCPGQLNFEGSKRGLVNVTVPENERIFVEPGDVVGFNLTSFGRDDNGIIFSDDEQYTNEQAWFGELGEGTQQQSICITITGNTRLNMSTNLAPLITAKLEAVMHTSIQPTQHVPTSSSTATRQPEISTTPTPTLSISTVSPNALPGQLTAGVGAGVAGLLVVVTIAVCLGCCCVIAKRKKETKMLGITSTSSGKMQQNSDDEQDENLYESVDYVSAYNNITAQQNLNRQENVKGEAEISMKMIQNKAYGDVNRSMLEDTPLYDTVSLGENSIPHLEESQEYVDISETGRLENTYDSL